MSNIKIIPCDVSVINTIASFTILLQNFIIGKSVDLIVSLFDNDNKFVSTILIALDGDAYADWGNDDTYLITFVCNKLNFSPEIII